MSQRRSIGGPRREASDRVFLNRPGRSLTGWALNVSEGGVRVVLEDPVKVGEVFDLGIGESTEPQAARVVWVHDEPDGQIVGMQFVGSSEPPPNSSTPPPRTARES